MTLTKPKTPFLYPVFVKLAGRKVVVVGGGRVAALKLKALLDASAHVTVVAPTIRPEIEQRPGVKIVRRSFTANDLTGAWLVIAAASQKVNKEVAVAAESRQIFVNAVDDPPNATAYLAGVVRRSGVTMAFSTDGQAPALAGLLREGFDAVLPSKDLQSWVDQALVERQTWLSQNIPMDDRRPLLLQALNRLYDVHSSAALPEPTP